MHPHKQRAACEKPFVLDLQSQYIKQRGLKANAFRIFFMLFSQHVAAADKRFLLNNSLTLTLLTWRIG